MKKNLAKDFKETRPVMCSNRFRDFLAEDVDICDGTQMIECVDKSEKVGRFLCLFEVSWVDGSTVVWIAF